MINIFSEIQQLKKVMVYRPNKEIENFTPNMFNDILLDDIPYLKEAQKEHDYFTSIMKNEGVEVVYLDKLLVEVLKENNLKEKFLDNFLAENYLLEYKPKLKEKLKEYLMLNFTNEENLVSKLIQGVKKDELERTNYLESLISSEGYFHLLPLSNTYFTRDISFSVGNGFCISKMKKEVRRLESLFVKYIAQYHKDFKGVKLHYDRNNAPPIEGGDVLVLSKETVLIGMGERTTPAGVEILAKSLFKEGFKEILAVELMHSHAYMHLDTVFTMVDYDTFVVFPELERLINNSKMKVYKITPSNADEISIKLCGNNFKKTLEDALGLGWVNFIYCGGGDELIANREQWSDGCNAFAISPKKVVVYDRNYVTNECLDKAGIKILEIKGSELSRGRGGPRCMTMPLVRES